LELRDKLLKGDLGGTGLARRRAERELLFRTIRQTCFATLLAATTICVVVTLFAGEFDASHLVGQLLARAIAFPLE
jgi:hypothetical protein